MRITLQPNSKHFNFHGLDIIICDDAKWVAVNENGNINSFLEEPKPFDKYWSYLSGKHYDFGESTGFYVEFSKEETGSEFWKHSAIKV